MIVATAHGARFSFYDNPSRGGPITPATEDTARDDNEVINAALTQRGVRKRPAPDTMVCPSCGVTTPSKHIRSTPKLGLLCMRCIVRHGNRCWIALE
jgi:hypothetical protein